MIIIEKVSKKCKICLIRKMKFNFSVQGKWISPYCKSCASQKSNDWAKNNKSKLSETRKKYVENNRARINERHRNYVKGYRLKNREKYLSYRREYNKKHPEVIREKKLWNKYGILFVDYQRMMMEQKGLCFICESPGKPERKLASLSVDHDHKTGKVRGLLCDQCNKGLGCFFDNPELLEKAAQYLIRLKSVKAS